MTTALKVLSTGDKYIGIGIGWFGNYQSTKSWSSRTPLQKGKDFAVEFVLNSTIKIQLALDKEYSYRKRKIWWGRLDSFYTTQKHSRSVTLNQNNKLVHWNWNSFPNSFSVFARVSEKPETAAGLQIYGFAVELGKIKANEGPVDSLQYSTAKPVSNREVNNSK